VTQCPLLVVVGLVTKEKRKMGCLADEGGSPLVLCKVCSY